MEELRHKFINALALFWLIFIFGILGYMIIEGWSAFDSIYMTVITLASVGYGETHPLSNAGRLFTIVLIIVGMGTFVYAISTVTAFFIEGELHGYLRRKKMKTMIDELQNHYIICGADEVGNHVIGEFHKTEREFVIIDSDEERIKKIAKHNENLLYIVGDPADDDILISAGITRAKGVVAALDSDKDNLFVVITARSLNPDVRIVSRSIADGTVAKLRKAGADAIVSTDTIGALRMASEMVRPNVVSFLDKMLRSTDENLRIEEIELTKDSHLVGKMLKDVDITDKTGLLVMATRNKNTGNYVYNPKSFYVFDHEDILIVIGTPGQREEFNKLFNIK
ncbi:MAG TPA: potassium channel protein [Candidatus Wallbacteria bacterium]|nr:potassium channel protein [Candidatus Wallbacteria bacterium]